jgi:opacity protein-like surface antigen
MQSLSMLSPRSFRPVVRAAFSISILAALSLPALAQVTGSPEPAPPAPASSSSDVQTAQVVEKPKGDIYKRDVGVSIFAQYTNKTNGNFIRLDPTSSGGGMLSYRQSPRWWFGYEANYAYNKYSDSYNKGAYRVDHGVSELTAAYLVKHRVYHGIEGFFSIGTGAIIFKPSTYGGILVTSGTPATQAVPTFVASLGVQYAFKEHWGVRVQYRDIEYKAPNFKLVALDAHSLRSSAEPAFGVYYRF